MKTTLFIFINLFGMALAYSRIPESEKCLQDKAARQISQEQKSKSPDPKIVKDSLQEKKADLRRRLAGSEHFSGWSLVNN